jgi:methionyl-tRNA synthetase
MEKITFQDFLKNDLRVGRIDLAEAIPKSKKLLLLKVSLGDSLGERQIVAGLAKHFSTESLLHRRVVVVANLEAAELAGHVSEGMLLAASSEDDSIVSLIDPGTEVPLGSSVG